jgi:hypothetical protein
MNYAAAETALVDQLEVPDKCTHTPAERILQVT